MAWKPREIEAKLKSKFGFSEAREHSSDHRWYELSLPGLTILTKVSHSTREIGPSLLAKIARQLRVKKPFFDGMMSCKHDSSAYRTQVRTDPVRLPSDP